jgi:FKBP-type peptidyl-prolyl cis-trans isomerase SlpA
MSKLSDTGIPPVGPNTKITLHFSLSLEDGSLVDSNFDKDPAACVFGDGKLLPGFELALTGLVAGAEQTIIIEPENGFGQHNPSNIQEFSRKDFADSLDIEVGLLISFADANKAELPGVVIDFDEKIVIVDFNHPLAGHTVSFKVKILSVEPVVKH